LGWSSKTVRKTVQETRVNIIDPRHSEG